MATLNYYGQPITPPEYFDGEHVPNPMSAGLPPCCSCGWTPHGDFTIADHLRDMGNPDYDPEHAGYHTWGARVRRGTAGRHLP